MTTPTEPGASPGALPGSSQLALRSGAPRDPDGPVFSAPWQAQAFALALALIDRGTIGWDEWTAALARAIREASERGDPDRGDTYYLHWVAALEQLLDARGLVAAEAVERRKDDWDRSARATPHGRPIVLQRS